MNRAELALYLSLTMLVAACSSDDTNNNTPVNDTGVAEDSGSNSDGTPGDDTGESSSPAPSAVSFSCSDSQSFDIPANPVTPAIKYTIKSESGSDGDIQFDCNTNSNKFSLTPGITSLNIIDLQKITDFNFSCNDGNKRKGNIKYDYKSGVITYTGTVNGQSASCTDTFISPLEAIISTDKSIRQLLLSWGDNDADLTSSTCPTDEEGKLIENFEVNVCSGTFNSHYTIIDHNAKTHRLSTKDTYTFN